MEEWLAYAVAKPAAELFICHLEIVRCSVFVDEEWWLISSSMRGVIVVVKTKQIKFLKKAFKKEMKAASRDLLVLFAYKCRHIFVFARYSVSFQFM